MKHKPPFVIITTAELKDGIEEYINTKQHKYRIILGLTEDIYMEYPDLTKVDAIKRYIMSQHEENHLKYVMIVGNADKVPTPMFYDDDIEEDVAYENYYSNSEDSVMPMFPLSRIPASDMADAIRQLKLAINYHKYQGNTRKTVCLTTDASTYGKDEYRQSTESVAEMITDNFDVIKCYDKESNRKELTEKINKGVDFLTYRGHGYCFMWGGSVGFTLKDVRNLNNGNNTPIVFSVACNTAAIHFEDNFAETWMKNLKAVAFLGASSPTYRKVNSELFKHIWEAIVRHGKTTVGDIFYQAILDLYKKGSDPDKVEHNIKCYIQLGDPTVDYLSI